MEEKLKEFTTDDIKDRFLDTAKSAQERMRWSMVLAGAGSTAERKKIQSSFNSFSDVITNHLAKLNPQPSGNKWETMSQSSKIDELKRQLDQLTGGDDEKDDPGAVAFDEAVRVGDELKRFEGLGLCQIVNLASSFSVIGQVPLFMTDSAGSLVMATASTYTFAWRVANYSHENYFNITDSDQKIELVTSGLYFIIHTGRFGVIKSNTPNDMYQYANVTVEKDDNTTLGPTGQGVIVSSDEFTPYYKLDAQYISFGVWDAPGGSKLQVRASGTAPHPGTRPWEDAQIEGGMLIILKLR